MSPHKNFYLGARGKWIRACCISHSWEPGAREWARSAGARTGVYTYKAIERAFSPCSPFVSTFPGALPQAGMVRAFGALRSYFEIGTDDWAHRPLIHSLRRELTIDHFHRAEGPIHTSLGQRPRNGDNNAMEGRRPDSYRRQDSLEGVLRHYGHVAPRAIRLKCINSMACSTGGRKGPPRRGGHTS